MSRRLTTIYYDVGKNLHYNASGEILRKNEYPYIHFKEKTLLNIRLVTDDSLTDYAQLSATDVFSASIMNETFTRAQTPMIKTENAEINLANDWLLDTVGVADPSLGELSIRLDANTDTYETKIGTTKELKDCWLEIQACSSGTQNIVFVCRMKFRCFNIHDDGEGSDPVTIMEKIEEKTSAITGKKYLVFKNSDGEVVGTMGEDA